MTDAAKLFDEVERQHPYSVWARRAQLMSAFSYYMAQKYTKSIELGAALPVDPPGQQGRALRLLSDRAELLRADRGRHPRPEDHPAGARTRSASWSAAIPTRRYAADARLKIDLVNDHLAGKEMEIGRFYQRRGKWLAAAIALPHRGRQISDHQPHARGARCGWSKPISPRHARAKRSKAAAVLGANYPGSKWYERSYKLIQRHAPQR